MRRRELLAAAGASLLMPPVVRAQQPGKTQRIGVLIVGNETRFKPYAEAFLEGMRGRGYVRGTNLAVEFRFAGNRAELEMFADELIGLRPDLLVATEITAVWLKARTSTLPIVLLTSADPVRAGLVQSLSRPGTNVTGMASLLFPLAQKQIELLVEILPGMSRVAMLGSPYDPPRDTPYFGQPEAWEVNVRRAAEPRGLRVTVHRAGNGDQLKKAFAAMASAQTEGLLLTAEAGVMAIEELGDEIRRSRIPTIVGLAAIAENTGLLSYGVDYFATYRYAAKFVDLIFKGARPAEIPVEQATRFELVVNLKTARALGVAVPPSLLLRADRVIE